LARASAEKGKAREAAAQPYMVGAKELGEVVSHKRLNVLQEKKGGEMSRGKHSTRLSGGKASCMTVITVSPSRRRRSPCKSLRLRKTVRPRRAGAGVGGDIVKSRFLSSRRLAGLGVMDRKYGSLTVFRPREHSAGRGAAEARVVVIKGIRHNFAGGGSKYMGRTRTGQSETRPCVWQSCTR
jgi:hypothetical protein